MVGKPETDLKIPRTELITETLTGGGRCETQAPRCYTRSEVVIC